LPESQDGEAREVFCQLALRTGRSKPATCPEEIDRPGIAADFQGNTAKTRTFPKLTVTVELQLLRAHGLIAKLPHTRRYRVTERGFAFMSAAIHLRYRAFPADMADAA